MKDIALLDKKIKEYFYSQKEERKDQIKDLINIFTKCLNREEAKRNACLLHSKQQEQNKNLRLANGYLTEYWTYNLLQELNLNPQWDNGSTSLRMYLGNNESLMHRMDLILKELNIGIDVKFSQYMWNSPTTKEIEKGYLPGKCPYTLRMEDVQDYYSQAKNENLKPWVLFYILDKDFNIQQLFFVNVFELKNELDTKNDYRAKEKSMGILLQPDKWYTLEDFLKTIN